MKSAVMHATNIVLLHVKVWHMRTAANLAMLMVEVLNKCSLEAEARQILCRIDWILYARSMQIPPPPNRCHVTIYLSIKGHNYLKVRNLVAVVG